MATDSRRNRGIGNRLEMAAICIGLVFLSSTTSSDTGVDSDPSFFHFQNIDFCLKLSTDTQYLFVPNGPDKGDAWLDLITIIKVPNVNSLDQLAVMATALPSEYRSFGNLVGFGGEPGSDGVPLDMQLFYETEFSDAMEFSLVNLLVQDKAGLIVAYSHRTVGASAYQEHSQWRQLRTSEINDELKSLDATKLKDIQARTAQCRS